MNKKIYRIGAPANVDKANATTASDLTDKTITPLGGFPHYGVVRNAFVMIKGGCVGCKKELLFLENHFLLNNLEELWKL